MKTLLGIVTLAVALTNAHPHHHTDLASVQDSANNIIYNGYIAPKGHVPYIVSLLLFNGTHHSGCGGSIIANTWILTAAHCLTTRIYVDIFYGTTTAFQSESRLRVDKENFIIHELYERVTLTNDIALIRTPHVEYTGLVKKVNLPSSPSTEKFVHILKTKACGWGNISRTETPERLRCANLQIISNSACGRPDSKLCTGVANGKATCSGDSGGPLVITYKNPLLIGVACAGTEFCGDLTGPSIFTRVSSYLKWIRDKTGIL